MRAKETYENGVSKARNPNKIDYEYDELKEDVKLSNALIEFLEEGKPKKQNSIDSYIHQIATYCYFLQKKIDDIIDEYHENQDEPPKKERHYKVRKDLGAYARHMMDNKQAKNTIANKIKRVKMFLKYNDVLIPNLNNIDLTKYDDSEGYYTRKDLPTRETVKIAINGANLKHKAIFAWVYTTGSARQETALLKVKHFFKGLEEFCESKTFKGMLEELDGKTEEKEVIPIIYMYRTKTANPYYTVTTPECVQIIFDFLKSRPDILNDGENLLFDIGAGGVSACFKDTNLKYGWGKKGRYNYFGCHRLRHNHYTLIKDKNLANRLEGRNVKDEMDDTYDHNDDPLQLRKGYKEVMHNFGIFNRYDVVINSDAYQQLLEEKNELKKKLNDTEREYENLKGNLSDMRTEIDNISHINDIAKIQDYIVGNELVNEYNLASDVINLYKEDIKKDDFEGVTNDYIEELIMVAYNRSVAYAETEFSQDIYDDELWKTINDKIDYYQQAIMWNLKFKLTKSQEKKIASKLREYAEELWLNKEDKVDETKVHDIVVTIATKSK